LLVPVVAVWLALDVWRQWSWKTLLPAGVGLVAVGAAFAPYLMHEASYRSNFLTIVGGAAQGQAAWGVAAFQLMWIALTSPAAGGHRVRRAADISAGAADARVCGGWSAADDADAGLPAFHRVRGAARAAGRLRAAAGIPGAALRASAAVDYGPAGHRRGQRTRP